MTILLARHGETDWNRELRFQGHADPPLNETGRGQAMALAERLAAMGVEVVYSSPLRRARQTAEIVAERLGLAVDVDHGLCEVDVGCWSGLSRSEVEERFPEAFRRWLDHGPGWEDGESYEEMAERVVAALTTISERHDGVRVLAVTHGGPIRAAQAYALGVSIDEARRLGPSLHNCSLFALGLRDGSFTRID